MVSAWVNDWKYDPRWICGSLPPVYPPSFSSSLAEIHQWRMTCQNSTKFELHKPNILCNSMQRFTPPAFPRLALMAPMTSQFMRNETVNIDDHHLIVLRRFLVYWSFSLSFTLENVWRKHSNRSHCLTSFLLHFSTAAEVETGDNIPPLLLLLWRFHQCRRLRQIDSSLYGSSWVGSFWVWWMSFELHQ